MCHLSPGRERPAGIPLVGPAWQLLYRTKSKLVRSNSSFLEDIFFVDKENSGRKRERDDRLRVQVPNVQIFHEYEHEGGVEGDVGELHTEVERQLDMQVVARVVLKSPEFL